jgi:hypothetical protein
MVGMPQGDDLGRSRIAPRGENRGLIRLGPAVGEERFSKSAGGRNLRQLLRQRDLRFVQKHRRHVLQLVDLRVHLLVHGFVAVTHAHRYDAAEEIEILVPVRVPNVLVFGARDNERVFEVIENRGEKKLLPGQNDFLFRHLFYSNRMRGDARLQSRSSQRGSSRVYRFDGRAALSKSLAGQAVGVKEVDDGIWLVSFMDYDLGYIELDEKTLQPLENPFGPKVLPMS